MMMPAESGIHVARGEGRSLRVLASQLEIKAGEEAQLGFGMFHSSFPPGAGMPLLHLHRSYEEAFYVLEGQVQFQLGPAEVHAGPGSAVVVPTGVPHCFRNVGRGDVRWVVVAAPAAGVTLIEEIGAVAPGDLDRMTEIMARHDSELLERQPHWDALAS